MSDVLAISPHLDDAVLSAGGRLATLAAAGHRVTVYTVFAGEPPTTHYSAAARMLHRTCGLGADPVALRRAEDRHAAEALSVTVRHGGFPDAVYRTAPDGGWLVAARTGPADAGLCPEDDLVEAVAEVIGELIAWLRPAMILTCASFGDHVDHRHTIAAVRAAAGALPVELWSDIPYAAGPVTGFPDALRRRCGPHLAEPHPVAPGPWRGKLAAVARYRSQHALLWPGEDDIGGLLSRQAQRLSEAFGGIGHCELFWRPA